VESGRRVSVIGSDGVSSGGPAIQHRAGGHHLDWILGGIQVLGTGSRSFSSPTGRPRAGTPRLRPSSVDIPRVASCGPGNPAFHAVSVGEAQAAARALERDLSQLDADLTDLTLWSDGLREGVC
jgi:hypothetical protein